MRHACSILLLATACTLQSGCLAGFVADRLIAPTNGGDLAGVVPLEGPGIFNGGGSLAVGPPESPATIVYWVMEPGPFAAEAVPVGEPRTDLDDVPAAADRGQGQRWVVVRASHPQLDHDLVLRRPVADAGPQPLGARGAAATVFLLQGWGSRQRTLPYLWHVAGWLADAGCRVILPDLRAQGDSSGAHLTFGMHERHDLAALATHLRAAGLLEGPLGVVGHSYGGATAIQWAATDPRVARILALSPYADGETTGDTVRNLLREKSGVLALLLRPLLTDAFFERVGVRIGEKIGSGPDDGSPIASLRQIDTPLLLVHGSDDRNVPVRNASRLRDARPAGTTFWRIDGAAHYDYLFTHQRGLHERLDAWVAALRSADRGPEAPP
ncbi:alpha/beta hydrolase [Phycisphaera mikurensis]|uniref:AB hydrolase-1 domain-containing protein n=1 Tax=Phycisphaera mikurensis (strain NBRC 102666 / KCTC 22515 / FYK2301M01) TaxID=1142394 RepID=I0IIC1_PHYMF|nr:alpha/beta fold hydrolase [Phycisphaera mikurensis]MBB6442428.1 pimeloyl-ACP methyl ester carboxylesterase [Phycisphaera mikurensis]BAM05009.1 hypothetical protein PSMK_28500 [Phycisphaera mikurensis NBRC 102666]